MDWWTVAVDCYVVYWGDMQVNTEDVTVPWGRVPDSLDIQMGRWRMAVFQDVQESFDHSKLYFLYDPVADENSGTTGGRKGNQGLVIFDLYQRCFTREIPIFCEGTPKFIFALKCPSSSGGSSFIITCTANRYGHTGLLLYRINLTRDGMNLESGPRALLSNFITVTDTFIVSMREDAPEVVLMTAPGLTVWRISCLTELPSSPIESFSVSGADLNHYYDAYLSQGKIYFLSQSPDGHFDHSRVHVLEITGQRKLHTVMCSPDPVRGAPCARKQAAIDSVAGYILLAGGEISYDGSVSRLVDYWFVDLSTFIWQQIPAEMPIPLIEPRLTATNSGSIYLWGDFDQPMPGMPNGTHLRILKITGFGSIKPPPYDEASKKPTSPPFIPQEPYPTNPVDGSFPSYPSLGFMPGRNTSSMAPYPPSNSSHPQNNFSYSPNQPFCPSGQATYPQEQQRQCYPESAPYSQNRQSTYQDGTPQQTCGIAPGPFSGQHAYYPPQEKQNCCLQ
uniref:Bm3463 n=3 Tax=Brugia TaxID=6278 RepID=A0A0H5SAY0_BRUMA|nr:Bm3463 [Brugia malayi]